jgi:isocitrate/isopropylmalate dehydrogenase
VVVPGVVESIKVITERASTRIALFAFEYAVKHGRKRVSAVHKANIMKLSDGLFLDCCRMVSREFPNVTYDEIIVDNCCMQLVLDPTRFDILLLENLYGDIVSDLCAGFVGGLGMTPGANVGEKTAVFEAVHGSAPDIAGRNQANPMALILSGVMMLEHLGEMEAARRVHTAVLAVLREGKTLTRDRPPRLRALPTPEDGVQGPVHDRHDQAAQDSGHEAPDVVAGQEELDHPEQDPVQDEVEQAHGQDEGGDGQEQGYRAHDQVEEAE